MLSFRQCMVRRYAPLALPLLFSHHSFATTPAVFLDKKSSSHASDSIPSTSTSGKVEDAGASGAPATKHLPQTRHAVGAGEANPSVAARTDTSKRTTERLLGYVRASQFEARTAAVPAPGASDAASGQVGSEGATEARETVAPSTAVEHHTGKGASQTLEQIGVQKMKNDFFEAFPCFRFTSPRHDKNFVSYELVYNLWKAAIPLALRAASDPVTEDMLTKEDTDILTICKDFLDLMRIQKTRDARRDNTGDPPAAVEELAATLFLLERSLTDKEDPDLSMQANYERILRNRTTEELERMNGVTVPIPSEGGLKNLNLYPNVQEGSERAEVEDYFKTLHRKNDHVLVISGESGSGKTHLGIHAATCGLAKEPTKNLILYLKVTHAINGLSDFEAKYRNLGEDDVEGKAARNTEAARILGEQMCSLCQLNVAATKELLKAVESNRCLFFERTILVVDEVITSKVLLKALSTSVESGFMTHIQGLNLGKFFGTTFIICCSTGSKDSILKSGSSPKYYKAIQMQPSKNLFKTIIGNQSVHESLLVNGSMRIVDNRRCAVLAAKGYKSLSFPPKGDNEKDEVFPQLKLGFLWDRPSQSIANTVGGYLATRTIWEYASMNGLKDMKPQERLELVSDVFREFLSIPSLPPGKLPFTKSAADPIAKGIVDVHIAVEEKAVAAPSSPTDTESGAALTPSTQQASQSNTIKERTETQTFTFSRAQMIMACSFYGTVAVPMNSADTFEVLSVTMFALYLRSFISSAASTSLSDVFPSFDGQWKDKHEDEDISFIKNTKLEEMFPPSQSQRLALGNLMFVNPSKVQGEIRINNGRQVAETKGALPFTVGSTHFGGVMKDIKESQKAYCITTLLSPPYSPYADSLIVCGKVLFLIQSKKRKDFGSGRAEVRTELLKMGLVPEGATREEMNKYAKNIVFTSAMCEALAITCVVPVFSVEQKAPNSKIHNMKVRMPHAHEVRAAKSVLEKAKAAAVAAAAVEEDDDDSVETPPVNGGHANKVDSFSKNDKWLYPLTFEPKMELRASFTRTVTENGCTDWEYVEDDTQSKR